MSKRWHGSAPRGGWIEEILTAMSREPRLRVDEKVLTVMVMVMEEPALLPRDAPLACYGVLFLECQPVRMCAH